MISELARLSLSWAEDIECVLSGENNHRILPCYVAVVPRYLCPMQDSISRPTHLTWQDTAFFVEPPEVAVQEEPVTSLFEGHLLRVADDAMLPKAASDGVGWVFLVLMGCILLLAFAQRGGDVRPSVLFRAAFDRATANHILRYASGSEGAMSFLMLLAGVVSIGLFVTAVLSRHALYGEGRFVDFLVVTAFVAIAGIVTRALYFSLGVLFRVSHLVRANANDRTALTVTCGVLLVPCSALYHFGPSSISDVVIMIGFGAMALLYLKELQRSVTILWNDTGVSAAHIFYYFCALKIMPLCVLVRIVTA